MRHCTALLGAAILAASLFLTSAAENPKPVSPQKPKKLTCCEEARAQKKSCAHNCCITAHKKGLSCVRCNPNKEDLVKDKEKEEKKPAAPASPEPAPAPTTPRTGAAR